MLLLWKSPPCLRVLAEERQNPAIQHNFREGIKVAQVLANQARSSSTNESFVIFFTPPTMVTHV
uniref:Putative ovule protein n=1 Tax=Solanum chacoense TaxID=4108 RepID=A0A0V0H4E7_SOLCH